MEGNIVGDLPKPSRSSKSKYEDLDAKARLAQENPGQAVKAATNMQETVVKTLRQAKRPPYVQAGGTMKISMRNSEVNEMTGKRIGDIYFVWEPRQEGN